jgi:hypothetical protein
VDNKSLLATMAPGGFAFTADYYVASFFLVELNMRTTLAAERIAYCHYTLAAPTLAGLLTGTLIRER